MIGKIISNKEFKNAAVDDSSLRGNTDGLTNYTVDKANQGNNINKGGVSKLFDSQIADQTHGFTGVNAVIKEYNKLTDETSRSKFVKTISQSNSSLGNYLKGLNRATAGILSYGMSLATATLKSFALQSATTVMNEAIFSGASFLISKGIGLITTGFDNWIHRIEKARKRTSELFNEFNQMNNTYVDHKKTVAEFADKYDELSRGVNLSTNKNESLSTEDYEKFLEINELLANSFPLLKKGVDENGNSILTLGTNGITVKKELEELLKTEENLNNFRIAQSLGDAFPGVLTYVEDANEATESLNKSLNKSNEEIGMLHNFVENGVSLRKDSYKILSGDTTDTATKNYVYAMQSAAQEFMNGLNDSRRNELITKGVTDSNLFTIETNESTGTFDFYANLYSLTPKEINHLEAIIGDNVSTLNGALKDQFSVQELDAKDKISEAENSWRDFIPNLISGMMSKRTFTNLDSDLQDIVVQIVKALDYNCAEAMNSYNSKDPYAFIRDKFIIPMSNLSDSDKELLKSNIKELLQLDIKDISKDNQAKITNLINSLAGILEKDPLEIRIALGFDVGARQDEKLVFWESITEGVNIASETTKDFTNEKQKANGVNKKENPIPFSKAWSKLGTESDEGTAKASAETKDKLLELAEAGKLTTEAFQESSVAQTVLKDTGLSAKEATEEINKLVENVKQLDSMRTGITAITSAYDEKKDSKQHIVSSSTLDSMYNTLEVREWDNTNKKAWENYKKCATDGKKSMADTKKAQDKLATAYINSNNFLANLDGTNQDYYKTLLTEMGVTNADAIITNKLARKKGLAAIKTADLSNMTSDEISKLIQEKGETEAARNAMKLFALEKIYADGNALSTAQDIDQLILLMESLGLATGAIKKYRDYKNGKLGDKPGDGMVYEFNARKEIEKTTKKLRKKTKIDPYDVELSKGNGSNGKEKDKEKKTKETKTEIDWLSRRLTRMQSIIDLTASKLQNLFSVKAKNKNLNDQIKETTALMKQYGIAAKRYQKKADSIAAGKNKGKEKIKPLPKSIITQVKSGKITKKSYPKLIKKYGQSYADRINQYIDYYDKAKDAKKNKQDAKAKVRDLKQQKQQTYIDLYDSRTARAEAKENIQTNAKAKNNAIDTQIKYTNLSYDKQITIAGKFKKNKAEADRLKYEKTQKIKELHEKQLQNYADEYNAKADLAEINSDNAVGYQKQNSFINTQLSYLKQSNAKQIEIAKLNGDTTEQDRLQAEYEAKKVELKQKQIENLKTDFENRISFTRNDEQDVSNRISEIEARGDIVQSSYYSALNRYEQSVLNDLNTELQGLKKEQNSFAKYSPEWYSLQSDIQSVENSISETNISIIENNKKIGELRQSMYDDIASRNNNAGSEAQFLAGLLGDNLFDDKTGSMTKEGLGVLGTYGIELEANTNTALSYKKDREEIEQAIASYNSGNAHALDSYGSLNKAEEKLNEAIKNQQEATTAEYASMKKIYDMMVKRYETQLAYMKSIIDAKKQVLSMEKDLYDYQKNISSQTKNIAALEKQLAALKGDDSEEGRAKRSRLQVSLDEANQELQDTEYERYISDQENMLDNMYTQYEDLLSELEKDFETVVKDGLNIIDANASSISTTLNEIADKYGYNPSGDMKEILSVMQSSNGTIVNTLPGTITNGLSELGRIFQEGANAIVAAYSGKTPVSGNNPDTTDGGGSGGGSNSNGGTERFRVENTSDSDSVKLQDFLSGLSGANDITKPLKRAKKNKTYESELNQKLSQYGYVVKTGTGTHGLSYINMFAQALGLKSGDGSYSSKGAAYKALKKKYPAKFRTGGIVRAKNVPKDGDFVPVRVNPDETILTQDFTKLLPGAVDTMKDFIKVPDYAGMAEPRQIGNTFGDIVINTELPNVKDSYDFANDLQNNRRTQRAIEVGVHDLMKQGKFTSNIQRF